MHYRDFQTLQVHQAAILLLGFMIAGCAGPAVEENEPTESHAGDRERLQEHTVASDELQKLYEEGLSWYEVNEKEFALESLWSEHNRRSSVVREDLIAGVRAVPGQWLLLVIADQNQPDSPFTVPYLASLVERVRNLDFRMISTEQGRDLLSAMYSGVSDPPPSYLLLDDSYSVAGCRQLRPDELNRLKEERGETLTAGEWMLVLHDWYMSDRGITVQAGLMNIVTAAGKGESDCPIRSE